MKIAHKTLALLLVLGCSVLYCGEKKSPAPMEDKESSMKDSQESKMDSATPEGDKDVAMATPESAEPLDVKKILKPCAPCHYLDKGADKLKSGLGPGLLNVYNRAPVIFKDKSPYAKWDDAALDEWLADPYAVKKGTKMTYKVTNAEKRKKMIQALKTLK